MRRKPPNCKRSATKIARLGKRPTDQKERGNFLLQEYFLRRYYYFYDSFTLIQKNHRRVKLQTLQFYINSKTIELQTRQKCNNFGQGGIHDANWAPFDMQRHDHRASEKKKVSSRALPVDDGRARFIGPALRGPHLLLKN